MAESSTSKGRLGPKALAKFAKELDWDSSVKNKEVRKRLRDIHTIVNGGEVAADPETDDEEAGEEDISGAIRVKLVVVGDGAVGKTSLLIVQATGKFPTEYIPTVFENYTAQMTRNDRNVLLHLWDTAGQEDYDRLRPLSYPGSDVVLLCFSTISKTSFDAVRDKWAPEVQHYVPDIPHILVGTKIDLRAAGEKDPVSGKHEPITTEMGTKMKQEIGAVKYCEVCAKDGSGMDDLFNKAVDIVLKARGDDGPSPSAQTTSVALGNATLRKKKKKKECILQ